MCGISGIIHEPGEAPRTSWEVLQRAARSLTESAGDLPQSEARIQELEACTPALREFGAFEELWGSAALRALLKEGAGALHAWESGSRSGLLGCSSPVATDLLERWNALWVRGRDLAWLMEQDVLACQERVRELLPCTLHQDRRARLEAWKLAAVLGNIGRMEVRGRDSLGLSVLISPGSQAGLEGLRRALAEAGLQEELEARLSHQDLVHGAIRLDVATEVPSLLFAFKVAEEVGGLGDNVAHLRASLLADTLFWTACTQPGSATRAWSHTRWASNGIISEENCHPVDEALSTGAGTQDGPWITAALNGDVDNYQELLGRLARDSGAAISPRITTDAKIIPVQIAHHFKALDEGAPRTERLREAFCRAVRDFEGSLAIVMHSSLDPDRVYLALRGSGQSMFVGLGPHGYTFASELYGVVEQTPRFLRMDGTTERVPGQPDSAGQIFILDGRGPMGLEGIEAWALDGARLELGPEEIKVAEITTRDINRGEHEHFLLKEIFDAPESVAKTLQGKLVLPRDSEGEAVAVNLGPEVFPLHLAERVQAGQIRRLLLIGQGTAAVAGSAIASMMERSLAGSGVEIRAVKAAELSGYSMGQDMSDTLVVAVSQSGTTTDTNRTVDLVRSKGAAVIGIVNRRNSDLTFRVDGVLYTSDGRDIEMSVASTKAFYSQVVAGYLVGLRLALLLETMAPREVRRELVELEHLPEKMRRILEGREAIEALADRYATTRRDWAVVGSGPSRAAADEIRIKLSELCYKSIATDFIEDKKHIDLSSEPLTLVCAAGLSLMALKDAVKEVAIFKSHKSIPIVICSEGFDLFEPYAAGIVYVPRASENASVLLNTVVGHLWGYYCALAIDKGAARLRPARALAVRHLAGNPDAPLGAATLKQLLTLGRSFQDELRRGRMNSSLSVENGVQISLLFQYFTGNQPLRQFAQDFQKQGTRANLGESIIAALSQAIQELSRPIDAIKHQAKTITVGISRLEETLEGPLFSALQQLSIPADALPYRDLALLKALTPAVEAVIGCTLYDVDGLGPLGEISGESRVKTVRKSGLATNLRSRADLGHPLVGTKQWVVRNRTAFVGRGRNDHRPLLMLPVLPGGQVEHLLLMHLKFVPQLPLEGKIGILRELANRYEDLKSQVEEANLIWHDEFLQDVPVEELLTLSVGELAEHLIRGWPIRS